MSTRMIRVQPSTSSGIKLNASAARTREGEFWIRSESDLFLAVAEFLQPSKEISGIFLKIFGTIGEGPLARDLSEIHDIYRRKRYPGGRVKTQLPSRRTPYEDAAEIRIVGRYSVGDHQLVGSSR